MIEYTDKEKEIIARAKLSVDKMTERSNRLIAEGLDPLSIPAQRYTDDRRFLGQVLDDGSVYTNEMFNNGIGVHVYEEGGKLQYGKKIGNILPVNNSNKVDTRIRYVPGYGYVPYTREVDWKQRMDRNHTANRELVPESGLKEPPIPLPQIKPIETNNYTIPESNSGIGFGVHKFEEGGELDDNLAPFTLDYDWGEYANSVKKERDSMREHGYDDPADVKWNVGGMPDKGWYSDGDITYLPELVVTGSKKQADRNKADYNEWQESSKIPWWAPKYPQSGALENVYPELLFTPVGLKSLKLLGNPLVQGAFGAEGAYHLLSEDGIRKTFRKMTDDYRGASNDDYTNGDIALSALGDAFDAAMIGGGVSGAKKIYDFAESISPSVKQAANGIYRKGRNLARRYNPNRASKSESFNMDYRESVANKEAEFKRERKNLANKGSNLYDAMYGVSEAIFEEKRRFDIENILSYLKNNSGFDFSQKIEYVNPVIKGRSYEDILGGNSPTSIGDAGIDKALAILFKDATPSALTDPRYVPGNKAKVITNDSKSFTNPYTGESFTINRPIRKEISGITYDFTGSYENPIYINEARSTRPLLTIGDADAKRILNEYYTSVQDELSDFGVVAGSTLLHSRLGTGVPGDIELIAPISKKAAIEAKFGKLEDLGNGFAWRGKFEKSPDGTMDVDFIEENNGHAVGGLAHQIYRTLHPKEWNELMERVARRGTGKTYKSTDIELPVSADELYREIQDPDNMFKCVVHDMLSGNKGPRTGGMLGKAQQRSLDVLLSDDRTLQNLINEQIETGKSMTGGAFKGIKELAPDIDLTDIEANKELLNELGFVEEEIDVISKNPKAMEYILTKHLFENNILTRGVTWNNAFDLDKSFNMNLSYRSNNSHSGPGLNWLSRRGDSGVLGIDVLGSAFLPSRGMSSVKNARDYLKVIKKGDFNNEVYSNSKLVDLVGNDGVNAINEAINDFHRQLEIPAKPAEFNNQSTRELSDYITELNRNPHERYLDNNGYMESSQGGVPLSEGYRTALEELNNKISEILGVDFVRTNGYEGDFVGILNSKAISNTSIYPVVDKLKTVELSETLKHLKKEGEYLQESILKRVTPTRDGISLEKSENAVDIDFIDSFRSYEDYLKKYVSKAGVPQEQADELISFYKNFSNQTQEIFKALYKRRITHNECIRRLEEVKGKLERENEALIDKQKAFREARKNRRKAPYSLADKHSEMVSDLRSKPTDNALKAIVVSTMLGVLGLIIDGLSD